MWLGCGWRQARKRWAENLVILRKTLVEIRLWAGPVQLGATGCAARLLGQIVQSALWKLCVSLSSCRKTKVKKLINVSYQNNRESSVFRISLHLYICIVGLCIYYNWNCALLADKNITEDEKQDSTSGLKSIVLCTDPKPQWYSHQNPKVKRQHECKTKINETVLINNYTYIYNIYK